MAFEFKINDNTLEQFISISLDGEIDICTAEQFKESIFDIIDNNDKNIRLDCTDLKYIDSSGLGVLVAAFKKIQKKDKKIHISNLKKNIEKLFLITNLDKILIIEE